MNGSFLDSDDDTVLDDYDDSDFDSIEAFSEDDDDRWSDDSEAARRNWPRYRRNVAPVRRASAAGVPLRKIGKVVGGTVQTAGGGRAAVKFQNPPAAASSVQQMQSDFKKALDAVRKDITGLDSRIEKNTATLDKKINAVDDRVLKLRKEMKAAQAQQGMSSILPMLLTPKPKLENVTFATAPGAGTVTTVTDSNFKKDDNLLPLLMLTGGLGGTDSGGGMGGMNPMMLAIMLMK